MPDIGGTGIGGAALVLAAAPSGRLQLIDATSVLPSLSAVPAAVLTGTPNGSVVQLVNPADPQAVLAQIRTVVQSPGPLTLILVGQLHLDRKGSQPHLALANTTAATIRYTALPWQWMAHELRLRPAGTTAAVVDLAADESTSARLAADRMLLSLGPGIALYGAVVPVTRRRVAPSYAQAVARQLRVGGRLPLHQLHQVCVQSAELPENAVLLAFPAPVPAPAPTPAPQTPAASPVRQTADQQVQDPHPAILEAARAGRHVEAAQAAAAWQEYAERTYGPGSRQAVHWLEVRADLARLVGDPASSAELWIAAATARLTAGQPPTDADVEGDVDRAHHQWTQIRDTPGALGLLEQISDLRTYVPGRQPGAVQALQRHAESLKER